MSPSHFRIESLPRTPNQSSPARIPMESQYFFPVAGSRLFVMTEEKNFSKFPLPPGEKVDEVNPARVEPFLSLQTSNSLPFSY